MRTLTLVLWFAALCSVLIECDGAVLKDSQAVDQPVETLAQTEKRLKKLINSGFKIALPYLMTAASEIKLNRQCLQALLMLVRGVMDIRDWAIKMVDALGKPSAGILEGTATAMGDYDECLDITVPRRMRPPATPPYTPDQIAFHGQYCVVQIHLPDSIRQAAMAYQAGNRTHSELANTKTFLRNLVKIAPRADVADLRLGVCIPSICNLTDLQAIVNEISEMVKFSANAVRCETKGSYIMETKIKVILSILGTIIFLSILGTTADVVLHFRSKDNPPDSTSGMKGFVSEFRTAFSMLRNIKKLLSLTPTVGNKISCIRGMKFISICLYIVVWTYATPQDFHFLKYRSAFYFHTFMEEWWFTIFANASAGVDTLFLIAGLQLSYRLYWKSKTEKVQLHIPKFIIKWFTRFSLSQSVVISLLLCLPLLGNGPIWGDVVTPIVQNCEERWWLNILGINNFWPTDQTCLPHTWLVCCLFHLLLLAPILLLILSKSLALGLFVNLVIIFGSSVAIAMVTLMNDLPPAPAFYFLSYINIKTIWQKLFIQAYDHVGPFCIGIILGFLLNRHDKIKLKKTTVIFGWVAALVCNLAVICGLYGYRHGEAMEITLSAIYASVHRVVWALGVAWIVFACAYGYGGFVESILSWRLFIPFDKISNMTYLLHPLMLFLHEGQLRERMYMAHLDQAMYATAYIVFTIAIAALCYVLCVAPFIHFEKKLWYYEEYSNSTAEDKVTEDKVRTSKECRTSTPRTRRPIDNIDKFPNT